MADETNDEPPKEDSVLSPDDLDITSDESVVEIDDGRYVISPGGNQPELPHQPPVTPRDEGDAEPQARELTEADVHAWIEERLGSADSKYAFDVTAHFEGRVSQKAMFSNDVVTTFENLVVWYAHHAGGDTPVEDVLGILLVESNLSVRFPPDALLAFAETNGLDGGDSIESLVEVARESGGFRFYGGNG